MALCCSACANGYSPSYAQAPLFFSESVDGDLVVAREDDAGAGGFEVARLEGDFTQGVQGYDVVGGNALLPVRRPVQQAALIAPLGGLVTAAVTPGANPSAVIGLANGLATADAALTDGDGRLAPGAGLDVGDGLATARLATAAPGGLAPAATAGVANGLATAAVVTAAPGGGLAPNAGLNVGNGLVTANVGATATGGAPQVAVTTSAAGLVGAGVGAGASLAGAAVGGVASTPGTTLSAITSATPTPSISQTRTLTTQGPLLGAPATVTAAATTATSLSGAAVNSLLGGLRGQR